MIKIKLQKIDIQKETDIFNSFLKHPKFPTHRKMIFEVFPELQKNIENNKNLKEEKIVKNFLKQFYQKNSVKINEIIEKSKFIIEQKTPECFKKLEELMNFENDIECKINITILPFSPFEEDGFFYSILGEINNKKRVGIEYDIAFLAVHEISHIILHKILKEKNINLDSWLLIHYLQEISAPVLMNQEPIKSILKITDYSGNPNLNHLYINNNDKEEKLVIFIKNIFEETQNKKESFKSFLQKTIKILEGIELEIKEKHDLWNKYRGGIKKEKNIFEQYKKPIKIRL